MSLQDSGTTHERSAGNGLERAAAAGRHLVLIVGQQLPERPELLGPFQGKQRIALAETRRGRAVGRRQDAPHHLRVERLGAEGADHLAPGDDIGEFHRPTLGRG
jgi:hypothetical protein